MGLYELRASVIFKTTAGWREQSSVSVVDCLSDDEAKLAGLLFVADYAARMKENYNDTTEIGCVKVYGFYPTKFRNGNFVSGSSSYAAGEVYEWKCDWYPYEKELEHIKETIAENEANDKRDYSQ